MVDIIPFSTIIKSLRKYRWKSANLAVGAVGTNILYSTPGFLLRKMLDTWYGPVGTRFALTLEI